MFQICRAIKHTHFGFNNIFSPENRAVCETMWKNILERGSPQMTK